MIYQVATREHVLEGGRVKVICVGCGRDTFKDKLHLPKWAIPHRRDCEELAREEASRREETRAVRFPPASLEEAETLEDGELLK